jgi:hypothetical protein
MRGSRNQADRSYGCCSLAANRGNAWAEIGPVGRSQGKEIGTGVRSASSEQPVRPSCSPPEAFEN